jgi:hypothetical protein
MYPQLRPAARMMCVTQKMRQSLLLAILICGPGWSIPIPLTVADLRERIWPPGPVYVQIGHSCVGYMLAPYSLISVCLPR